MCYSLWISNPFNPFGKLSSTFMLTGHWSKYHIRCTWQKARCIIGILLCIFRTIIRQLKPHILHWNLSPDRHNLMIISNYKLIHVLYWNQSGSFLLESKTEPHEFSKIVVKKKKKKNHSLCSSQDGCELSVLLPLYLSPCLCPFLPSIYLSLSLTQAQCI